MPGRRLTSEERQRIVAARGTGRRAADIAKEFRVSIFTVNRLVREGGGIHAANRPSAYDIHARHARHPGFPKTLPCLRCDRLRRSRAPSDRFCDRCRSSLPDVDVRDVRVSLDRVSDE
jgi:hypothetical protein